MRRRGWSEPASCTENGTVAGMSFSSEEGDAKCRTSSLYRIRGSSAVGFPGRTFPSRSLRARCRSSVDRLLGSCLALAGNGLQNPGLWMSTELLVARTK